MNREIFEQDGQKYLRIGDRAIPFSDFDASGNPIIKPLVENVVHADGRKDVKIIVPFLTIQSVKI